MTDEWSSSVDLFIDLDLSKGVRQGIEQSLREAIRDGRLHAGTCVPSSRALARDLGVSRGTVSAAYGQLTAEGYLTGGQGAVSRVAVVPPVTAQPSRVRPASHWAWDLRPGQPDVSSFPRDAWARAARQVFRQTSADALGYGDVMGQPELREALEEYLGRARGVRIGPAPLLICSGFTQALAILCQTLRAKGARTLGVEEPGAPRYRRTAVECGLRVVPLPCDGKGLNTACLPEAELDAVLITPAHQYPLGATLSVDRRGALIEWARQHEALIIEDDYDGEFRFDRNPVGALQQLDPEHVVYVGSASKTLVPGLRIGWMTLPPLIEADVLSVKDFLDRGSSVFDQLTFARLINSGQFDRHIRHMRTHYRKRRDLLLELATSRFPQFSFSGISAGLHVVLTLSTAGGGRTDDDIARLAAKHSIALQSMHDYWHTPREDTPRALVIGYGTPPSHAYRPTLDALMRVLGDLRAEHLRA